MSEPTLFGAPAGGIVGRRQLIAVQTIELGRLTHHPVPLVPSALVAVSGTGPDRDSNGSGKTTFLASVSLLLGDPEWRVATTGGADALGLLFDPDLSGDAAGLYDPARRRLRRGRVRARDRRRQLRRADGLGADLLRRLTPACQRAGRPASTSSPTATKRPRCGTASAASARSVRPPSSSSSTAAPDAALPTSPAAATATPTPL